VHNLDDPTPKDLETFRNILRAEHSVDQISDAEIVAAMCDRP
jgi:hypothetical protein